jgi:hypothetical protein
VQNSRHSNLLQDSSANYIMSGTTSPALPAFSYAQAAKGLAPSTSAPHVPASVSATSSTASSGERKASTTEPVKLELTSKPTNSQNEDSTSPGKTSANGREIASVTNDSLKENIQPSKPSGASNEETKVTVSGTSSPSFEATSSSTLSKEEDISITPNETSDNWDKQSQVSTSVEKSTQTTGETKMPDKEDDWEKEPVPKPSSDKELKAAPIPTVNFWQARKEAQEAKAKALAAQRPPQTVPKPKTQPANVAESQKAADDDPRRKQSGKPTSKLEKENGAVKRRQGDAVKQRDDGSNFLPQSVRRSQLTLTKHVASRLNRLALLARLQRHQSTQFPRRSVTLSLGLHQRQLSRTSERSQWYKSDQRSPRLRTVQRNHTLQNGFPYLTYPAPSSLLRCRSQPLDEAADLRSVVVQKQQTKEFRLLNPILLPVRVNLQHLWVHLHCRRKLQTKSEEGIRKVLGLAEQTLCQHNPEELQVVARRRLGSASSLAHSAKSGLGPTTGKMPH